MLSMSVVDECVPGRILLVEDDRAISTTVSAVLEDEGYEVEAAWNGDQALCRLRSGPRPDLIILDLVLPVVDGWQLRAIQRADPALAAIPVLAVSAENGWKAAAIDAAGFLRKPFQVVDLLERVHRILGDRLRLEARMAETERLAAVGMLAAEAAHEMSNPLCSVMANVTDLEGLIGGDAEGAPSEVRTRLAELRVGAERVVATLRGLQMVARGSNDALGPVDVRAALEPAIAITNHQFRNRAQVVTDVPITVPMVLGNACRLSQLFTNLLINAAHAIAEGRPHENEVRVRLEIADGRLVVAVKDTGKGMSKEVLARIFEPFFTTKPAGVGTGLGLPVCQAIAREHGGYIEVESQPGRGTTFRVNLPIARDSAREALWPGCGIRGRGRVVH